MYHLGSYQEALVILSSDDATRTVTLHLSRTASRRLLIRDGRNGPDLCGVSVEDDGAVRVLTWDADGVVSGVLVVREPEKKPLGTRETTGGAVVVSFALLPRGSWRATYSGCELDVWQHSSAARGPEWRWSTLGPDGRYRDSGGCASWDEAAQRATAAAESGS